MRKCLNEGLFTRLFILFGLITCLLMQSPTTVTAAHVADRIILKMDSPIISINDIEKDQGMIPVIKDGVILVPIRPIFEALSIEIDWDSETKTLTALRGIDKIKVTIGENIAYKNETQIKLETPPVIVKGSTMLPTNFIAEILGADIEWGGEIIEANVMTEEAMEANPVEQPPAEPRVRSANPSTGVGRDDEIYSYYLYTLEIDGVLVGCREVTQSNSSIEKLPALKKAPSLNTQHNQITLQWLEDNDYALYNWLAKHAATVQPEKKTVYITQKHYAYTGKPTIVWKIVNAQPTLYSWNGQTDNGMDVDELVLIYDEMTVEWSSLPTK